MAPSENSDYTPVHTLSTLNKSLCWILFLIMVFMFASYYITTVMQVKLTKLSSETMRLNNENIELQNKLDNLMSYNNVEELVRQTGKLDAARQVIEIDNLPKSTQPKKLPKNKIRGIYVPSFAFDANTASKYIGVLVKEHKHTDSKGNTHTTYEYINIAGNKLLNFTNVTIESSSKMQNKDMKALLPYDLKSENIFNPDFIRGFSTEHYEDSVDKCYGVAKSEMSAQIKASILSEYKSRYHYDSVKSFSMNTLFSEEKFAYRLVPVYCFEFIYKKKKYITFMNGQTGKIGTGYPKSYLKVFLIILAVVLFIAFCLVMFYITKD